MLQHYIVPVKYAFLLFPVVALLFTLPFLIVQYRKYGYVHKLRSFLLYLFLLYLINAVFLVLLPLPESRHNLPPAVDSYVQLIPFQFIDDIVRETAVVQGKPETYLHLFKERAVLQVVLNILLTMPFGMFLRYYFGVRWLRCLGASFCLALFFEVTQVTGIYGFYDYPYRLFDVDDLMLNTLGGMVGFVVASWLSALLPRIDKLDEGVDLLAKRVSYTRRAIALLFDSLLAVSVLLLSTIVGYTNVGIMIVVGYFILFPLFSNGQTIGKMLVRIRIVGSGERLRFSEIFTRNGLLYGVWWGGNVYYLSQGYDITSGWVDSLISYAVFVINVTLFIHVLACLFNHKKQLFYERLSHTRHQITLKPIKNTEAPYVADLDPINVNEELAFDTVDPLTNIDDILAKWREERRDDIEKAPDSTSPAITGTEQDAFGLQLDLNETPEQADKESAITNTDDLLLLPRKKQNDEQDN